MSPLTQYPSGGVGDFGVVYRDSKRDRWEPKKSKIWYFDGTTPKMTEFGFDITNPEPYWYKLPGRPESRFRSIEAYQNNVRFVMAQYGIVPDIKPAPPMHVGEGYDHNPPLGDEP